MFQDAEIIAKAFLSVFTPWSHFQYALWVPATLSTVGTVCEQSSWIFSRPLMFGSSHCKWTTSSHTAFTSIIGPLGLWHPHPTPLSTPLADPCQVLPVKAWLGS